MFIYFNWRLITILYWFCHTSTWIRHGCTHVPHPESPSHLPPHPIPLGHPSAPAPSILYPALNLDWRFISHRYYTCFNAILPNHPTIALSHRVQKTVLYICVFFAVSHTGLSLPSFWISYTCVSMLYWWRRQWQPTPVLLPRKWTEEIKMLILPWMEEPGRLQPMGSLRVKHDWATSLSLYSFMHWRRKWQPTPAFLPGESQGQGPWWAAVYGVAQSWTRLKRLSSSSSMLYWCFSFWFTLLCMIGSSFIHLIRTDSNVFFLMAE